MATPVPPLFNLSPFQTVNARPDAILSGGEIAQPLSNFEYGVKLSDIRGSQEGGSFLLQMWNATKGREGPGAVVKVYEADSFLKGQEWGMISPSKPGNEIGLEHSERNGDSAGV